MNEMRILVKFPTRGRNQLFFEALDKYYGLCTRPDLMHVQVTIDSDDAEMNNPETLDRLSGYGNLSWTTGHSISKIHAVNRDLKTSGWDILLLASDDMIPVVKGYDEVIRSKMREFYPDTDGILWFNDGNRSDLNTLSIFGKKYYDRFNYIYYPGLKSMYGDYDFMLVGNILRRQTYIPEVIIRHEHPAYGYREMDDTYEANDVPWDDDSKVFHRRKAMNFGIGPWWKLAYLSAKWEARMAARKLLGRDKKQVKRRVTAVRKKTTEA